jgi:hypothetical protein
MVLTINPAVCGTLGKYLRSVVYFAIGVAMGSFFLIVALRLVLTPAALIGQAMVGAVLGLAAMFAILRDFGLPTPVPYRNGQVPEVFRDSLSQTSLAFVFGAELGFAIATVFTTSLHLLFAAIMFTLPIHHVILGCLGLAVGKSVVLLTLGSAPRRLADVDRCIPDGRRKRVPLMRAGTGGASLILLTWLVFQQWTK